MCASSAGVFAAREYHHKHMCVYACVCMHCDGDNELRGGHISQAASKIGLCIVFLT